MTISIEEYLAIFEEELEKKEGQLTLLEEKLNASRLLIKLHFGELLPENLKKYILIYDSTALPNENNSSQDSISKKSSNNKLIILENHISCIEQVLQCKERINELKHDIQVLKNRK